jgi:hypothetical protein
MSVEKINAHVFMFNSFFCKIVPFMTKWKNIVERGRPQMTIWRTRLACWIPKATNKHNMYITFCFSPATVVAQTLLSVTFYFLCQSFLFLVHMFLSPMPPHVPHGLRGLPSRLWPKCNRLLRLGRPWGAVTLSQWGGWWYMNVKYQERP